MVVSTASHHVAHLRATGAPSRAATVGDDRWVQHTGGRLTDRLLTAYPSDLPLGPRPVPAPPAATLSAGRPAPRRGEEPSGLRATLNRTRHLLNTLFDPMRRHELLARLENLTPQHQPQWGRMTAPQMVCHVSAGLRQCLGEIDLGRGRGLLARWPLNWLTIHMLPWPKGAKTAPGLLTIAPRTWDADVSALRELIERFGARDPAGPWPPSVVFGDIAGKTWGVLEYRHLDHHFRQFGI